MEVGRQLAHLVLLNVECYRDEPADGKLSHTSWEHLKDYITTTLAAIAEKHKQLMPQPADSAAPPAAAPSDRLPAKLEALERVALDTDPIDQPPRQGATELDLHSTTLALLYTLPTRCWKRARCNVEIEWCVLCCVVWCVGLPFPRSRG